MPARAMAIVPPVALLATVTVPETVPLAAGSNVAINATVWPGGRMVPEETPLALKPGPETLTFESAIDPVPLFISVIV